MSSSILHRKSPFEVLFKKPFDPNHLRVLGSLCYATNFLGKDKLTSRSIPSVLLGYSSTHKGYILLNIQTGAIFASRDVSFNEHIFSF